MKRTFNPQPIALIAVALAVVAVGVYVFSGAKLEAPQQAEQNGGAELSRFEDKELSLAFSYSPDYTLEKREIEVGGAMATYLTLIPADYVPPQGGEGPPALTVAVYPNPQGKPLADWLAGMTNAAPTPTGGWDFSEATIDGRDGLAYTSTGLYESDNVAVAANGNIYVFSAAWMTREDRTLNELDTLLRSVNLD
jgi:hypothetical protein